MPSERTAVQRSTERRVSASEPPLIARERELETLREHIARTIEGHGGLLLIAGEAGAGKSAVVDCAVSRTDLEVLRAGASIGAPAPYGPLLEILRTKERTRPGFLVSCGALAAHLALLLPELGAASPAADRGAVAHALCDALRDLARDAPAVVVLEDLQWYDEATLELLPQIAAAVRDAHVLVLATYRSDEVPRGHGIRRLRAELRRARTLAEISVEPLGAEATAMLVERIAGHAPPAALASSIFERSGGVPFFVEELTSALVSGGRLREGGGPVDPRGGELPLPETVRDAVRLRTDRLSPRARAALEFAAVVAAPIEPGQLPSEETIDGIEELLHAGLLVDRGDGLVAFRHPLVRESAYADIPWTRRRALHRQRAESLERSGGAAELVAGHWLGAHEPERARPALVRAARAFCAVHAYRDAARLGRQALDLWPQSVDEKERLAAIDQLAHCSELSGDLAEAARAWQEVRDAHAAAGAVEAAAETSRRLAGVFELQGLPERTRAAREDAAAGFARCGRLGDSVLERLVIAERLELAGSGSAALTLLTGLAPDIESLGSVDLRIRAMALEGEFRAKLGERESGLAAAREALRLALEHERTGPAAEAYYRLGAALENACDHDGAVEAYTAARSFCLGQQIDELAQVCLACMLPAVLLTGQWSRTREVARNVLASPHSPMVARMKAKVHLGLISVMKGNATQARRLFDEAYAFSQQTSLVPIEVFSTWGIARSLELQGRADEAMERCRELVRRAAHRDEIHYTVPPLRWAATLFATHGQVRDTGACADLLARMGGAMGHPEVLGPLAHALGELALARGDAETAARHFEQALGLMAEAGLPYERAEVELRAAAALAAGGRQAEAVQHLTAAYRTARKLAARPLMLKASAALRELGEPVERHLGRRAAADADAGGLSRREVEVLELVTDGLTNREIADRLYISRRTVDMHVRNVLARLGCRSRVEAAGRARALSIR